MFLKDSTPPHVWRTETAQCHWFLVFNGLLIIALLECSVSAEERSTTIELPRRSHRLTPSGAGWLIRPALNRGKPPGSSRHTRWSAHLITSWREVWGQYKKFNFCTCAVIHWLHGHVWFFMKRLQSRPFIMSSTCNRSLWCSCWSHFKIKSTHNSEKWPLWVLHCYSILLDYYVPGVNA